MSLSRRRLILLALVMVATALAPRLARAQAAASPATAAASLTVAGDVATPLSLSLGDLQSMPRKTIEVGDGGERHTYEGVLVSDLLSRAGMTFGQMGSRAVASYIVAGAGDGYQAVFAIAELDPTFGANGALVADRVDGKPIAVAQGPLRLIVAGDKRAGRWVRQLRRLEVVRLVK